MNFKINYKILFILCALIFILAYSYIGIISDDLFPLGSNQIKIESGNLDEGSNITIEEKKEEEEEEEDNGDYGEGGDESEILPEDANISEASTIKGVPFSSQSPFGDWEDPRQQHGCEEASLLMAHYWILGEGLSKDKALSEIVAMSEFEDENFGGAYDLSISDTLKLWNEYFDHKNAFTKYDITLEDIKKEIAGGNLVIVPIDGVKLGNPHYTAPGPEFHEMVVIGYDDEVGEFITHDPGTRFGANYRYDYNVFMNSIRDYKTGFNEPVDEVVRAMLVIERG